MVNSKVLFLYPNYESEFRIPLSISLLSASLKKKGHEVALFDTTFMTPTYNRDNELMEKRGVVVKTKLDEYIGPIEEKDIFAEFLKVIYSFDPDLIAVSLLERNFGMAKKLMELVKQHHEIPILVGGILPTLIPERIVSLDFVDMICVGEGEQAIVEVADRIASRKPLSDVQNIWFTQDGNIVKNPLRPLIAMDELPYPDWSIFDERHMWKTFMGNVYKAGSFEFSRGCLNNCSFCVAPNLRKAQGAGKHYLRRKSTRQMIDEIRHMKEKYGFEMISFCDTNFLLLMTNEEVKELEALWCQEIKLPFTIQTEVKTINDFTVGALKNMGCIAISVGVESGCKEIREKVLNKHISNEQIFDAFKATKKHKIRTTANYIIGLPFETEEQILESIQFNLDLKPDSIAVHFFVPFLGTELYDLCLKEGFITGFTTEGSVYETSIMSMSNMPKDKISDLLQLFIDRFNEVVK